MEINNKKVSFSKGINFRLPLVLYQYVHYDKDGENFFKENERLEQIG